MQPQPPPPHCSWGRPQRFSSFFFWFHFAFVSLSLSPLHPQFFTRRLTRYPLPSRHNQPLFLRLMWSIGARKPFCRRTMALQLALIGIDCLSAQYVKPSRNNTCTHSMKGSHFPGKHSGNEDACECTPSLLVSQSLSCTQIVSSQTSHSSTALFSSFSFLINNYHFFTM